MRHSIIGTGAVGRTLAGLFARAGVEVGLGNTRGAEAVRPLAEPLGPGVVAQSREEALAAEVVFAAVPFLKFKDLASALPNWGGRIVVDVTNALNLTPEVLQAELGGRLSSVVNAEHAPGARLVKAFNHLPVAKLAGPTPDGAERCVFVAGDHEDAAAEVAELAKRLGFAPIRLGRLAEGGRLVHAGEALVFQDLVRLETQ